MEMGRKKPGPKTRLSAEKRERFLEVLGQTGNRTLAAEAIGVEPRLMDQRREFDPLFDRQWREAVEQADRRLAGASGPLDCIGGAEPMVIRRGRGGLLKIVKAGPRRWSRPVEALFFGTLAATGNIAASARAVGFSLSCIARRRRNVRGFAEKLEAALEDAEMEIEFRMAAEVRGLAGAEDVIASEARQSSPERGEDIPAGLPRRCAPRNDGEGPVRAAGFDIDAAMRFLKWREEKRRGGGGGARPRRGLIVKPEPPIEQVRDDVLRRLAAMRRQRERKEGRAGDES